MKNNLWLIWLLVAATSVFSQPTKKKGTSAPTEEVQPDLVPGTPAKAKKWKLTFSDEFDGKELNQEVWVWQRSPDNSEVKNVPKMVGLDGKGYFEANLKKNPKGSSSKFDIGGHGNFVTRNFSQSYGYFETKMRFIQLPLGFRGAFWLYPYSADASNPFMENGGIEIDIVEDSFGWTKAKRYNQQSVWIDAPSQDGGNAEGMYSDYSSSNPLRKYAPLCRWYRAEYTIEGWAEEHTAGVEWTPLGYTFYMDGKVTVQRTYKDTPVSTEPLMVIMGILGKPSDFQKWYPLLKESLPLLDADAQLEDKVRWDYVRVWAEDVPSGMLPVVNSDLASATLLAGSTPSVKVSAKAAEGELSKLLVFSNGRLLGEQAVSGKEASHTFQLPPLFAYDPHIVIAMAQDAQGRVGQSPKAYLRVLPTENGAVKQSKPYQGKAQTIPGHIVAGLYDEGGQLVAYNDLSKANQSKTPFRPEEGVDATENSIGHTHLGEWVNYTIDAQKTGKYRLVLHWGRAHSSAKDRSSISLLLDEEPLATLPTNGSTGPTWAVSGESVGAEEVQIAEGRHVLRVRFNDGLTNFGGVEFIYQAK